jgi:hypothetical protein
LTARTSWLGEAGDNPGEVPIEQRDPLRDFEDINTQLAPNPPRCSA